MNPGPVCTVVQAQQRIDRKGLLQDDVIDQGGADKGEDQFGHDDASSQVQDAIIRQ